MRPGYLAVTLAAFAGLLGTPAAAAQPPSGPTADCRVGDFQNEGPYDCVCADDGQWVCHEREQQDR